MSRWTVAVASGMAVALLSLSIAAPHRSAQDVFAGERGGTYGPDLPAAIPKHVWEQHIPPDNPMTRSKIELGRDLFFDPRLSADDTVSCAHCHKANMAFTDQRPVSEGIDGKTGTRSAPTVLNSMFHPSLFWDGRALSLEDQAKQPLINPVEMGMKSHEAVVNKLKGLDGYQARFQEVFGGDVTIDRIARAIAAFERTQVSGDSPFDRFVAGDKDAISASAKRGWELFRGKAACQICHTFIPDASPFFTDFKFHNLGIGARKVKNFDTRAQEITRLAERKELTSAAIDELALSDREASELGRFLVTMQPQDLGGFKTPTLRDVNLTPPYMHDGSIKTLKEVMKFYNKGGHPNKYLDPLIRPLGLTNEELNDMVEFMKSLTSDRVSTLTREEVLSK